jgi:hypothetical protein
MKVGVSRARAKGKGNHAKRTITTREDFFE